MKILVCIKQVPEKDALLRLSDDGKWIREDVPYEVNEPDAYALEEALRLKERSPGSEVVALTAGPIRALQVLREALAKGADRAIHIEDDRFVRLGSAETAQAIAAALCEEHFDLVVTGLQSDDHGSAQTGVLLAGLLGIPHATIIIGIEQTESGLRVKRELESGYYQYLDMPLPAVLTIQSGINRLRYATLLGIKRAKTKPVRKVSWEEIGKHVGPERTRIERLYVPEKHKKTRMIEAPPAEAAKHLVDYLKNEAHIL